MQRELAEFVLSVRQAGNRSGHADRFVSGNACVFNHVALSVEIHIRRRSSGRLLAVVNEVSFAIRRADEHETAASEISSLRMYNGQGESGGDGCIYRVPACLHHFHSRT